MNFWVGQKVEWHEANIVGRVSWVGMIRGQPYVGIRGAACEYTVDARRVKPWEK